MSLVIGLSFVGFVLAITLSRAIWHLEKRDDRMCQRINALETQIGELKGLDMRDHWLADENQLQG